jgi:hypothetical protein
LGCETCDEFFDLTNRLVFGIREHLLVIIRRQVGPEAMDAAQVNFAAQDTR